MDFLFSDVSNIMEELTEAVSANLKVHSVQRESTNTFLIDPSTGLIDFQKFEILLDGFNLFERDRLRDAYSNRGPHTPERIADVQKLVYLSDSFLANQDEYYPLSPFHHTLLSLLFTGPTIIDPKARRFYSEEMFLKQYNLDVVGIRPTSISDRCVLYCNKLSENPRFLCGKVGTPSTILARFDSSNPIFLETFELGTVWADIKPTLKFAKGLLTMAALCEGDEGKKFLKGPMLGLMKINAKAVISSVQADHLLQNPTAAPLMLGMGGGASMGAGAGMIAGPSEDEGGTRAL